MHCEEGSKNALRVQEQEQEKENQHRDREDLYAEHVLTQRRCVLVSQVKLTKPATGDC